MTKKKMSVADILAAARKSDGTAAGNDSPADKNVTSDGDTQPAEAPSQESEPAAEKPAPKPGDKMSTADILAMARSGDKKPAAAAKPEAPAKKAAVPSAAAAPSAKESPKPAAKAGAKAATSAALDTASILAAARKSSKAGPMSKQEAAAKADPRQATADAKKPVKAKLSVPPAPTKPGYARPKVAKASSGDDRRGFLSAMLGTFMGLGFMALSATTALWTLATARFMFPNVLMEPPSQFKVGPPSNFPLGNVETKFKGQFGVWVVHGEYNGKPQIYALSTVCTHLGCTPNWLEAEQKFKCPCHGSGFYKDGINFEGPAPRPLERYAIQVADDGQLEVDKSKKFQEEMGQWNDPASYVAV